MMKIIGMRSITTNVLYYVQNPWQGVYNDQGINIMFKTLGMGSITTKGSIQYYVQNPWHGVNIFHNYRDYILSLVHIGYIQYGLMTHDLSPVNELVFVQDQFAEEVVQGMYPYFQV